MNVVVTGATGFIGRSLVPALAADRRFSVSAVVRSRNHHMPPGVRSVVSDNLASDATAALLEGSDVVVHLAGRAHVMRETESDPLSAFRRVNVEATARVARQAASAGVRRFVFLSTLKVHGEEGGFSESDPPAPQDPYSVSKAEAEAALREIESATQLEVVIVRPPLVYGPGVKANFRSLMNAVRRGIPLPLGAVHNRRSLVGTGNLNSFIMTCATHPAAAGRTFLVTDGEDLSTRQLVIRLAQVMKTRARLVPVPPAALRLGAALVGGRASADRLLQSLWADISLARAVLGWTPPVTVLEGLHETVAAERGPA